MININDRVKINNPTSSFNGLQAVVENLYPDEFKTKPDGSPIMVASLAINFPAVNGYNIVREVFPVDFLVKLSDNGNIDLIESFSNSNLYEISKKESNPFTSAPFFFELTDFCDENDIYIEYSEKMDKQGNYILKDFFIDCTNEDLKKILEKFPNLAQYITTNRNNVNKIMKEINQEHADVDLVEDTKKQNNSIRYIVVDKNGHITESTVTKSDAKRYEMLEFYLSWINNYSEIGFSIDDVVGVIKSEENKKHNNYTTYLFKIKAAVNFDIYFYYIVYTLPHSSFIEVKTPNDKMSLLSEYENIINTISNADIDLIEAKKDNGRHCCICGRPLTDYGNNPWGAVDSSRHVIEWNNTARCCDECNQNYVTLGRLLAITNRDVNNPAWDKVAVKNKIDPKYLDKKQDQNVDLVEHYHPKLDIHIFDFNNSVDYLEYCSRLHREFYEYIVSNQDYAMLDLDPNDYNSEKELNQAIERELNDYVKDFVSEVKEIGYNGIMKHNSLDGYHLDNGRFYVKFKSGNIYISSGEYNVSYGNMAEGNPAYHLDPVLTEYFDGMTFLDSDVPAKEYNDYLAPKVDLIEKLTEEDSDIRPGLEVCKIYDLSYKIDFDKYADLMSKDIIDYLSEDEDSDLAASIGMSEDIYNNYEPDSPEYFKELTTKAKQYARERLQVISEIGVSGKLAKDLYSDSYVIAEFRGYVKYKNGIIYVDDGTLGDAFSYLSIVDYFDGDKLSAEEARNFNGKEFLGLDSGSDLVESNINTKLTNPLEYYLKEDPQHLTDFDFINAIEVSDRKNASSPYPPFDKYKFNVSRIPNNMRPKYYEISHQYSYHTHNISEIKGNILWITQEPFTPQDLKKFIGELTRCIQTLLKVHGFEEVVRIKLTIYDRDGQVTPIEQNIDIDIGKGIDLVEDKKYDY